MFQSTTNSASIQGQSQGQNSDQTNCSSNSFVSLRNVFIEFLRKTANEVNASSQLTTSEEALEFIESLLLKLLSNLIQNSPKTCFELEDRVLKVFPSPVDKSAVKFAQQQYLFSSFSSSSCSSATISSSSSSTLPISTTSSTLILSLIEKVQNILVKEILGYKIDSQFVSYLLALFEYIAIDCFKLTGNYVRNIRHNEIKCEDVRIAINADKYLMQIFYGKDDDDNEDDDFDSSLTDHLTKTSSDEDNNNLVNNQQHNSIDFANNEQQHAYCEQQQQQLLQQQQLTNSTFECEKELEYLDVVKWILGEERNFLHILKIVIKIFRDPFQRLLNQQELDSIFSNIHEIYEFALNFVGLVEDVIEMNGLMMIGCVFEELLEQQEFDVFEKYSNDFCSSFEQIHQKIQNLLLLPSNLNAIQQQQWSTSTLSSSAQSSMSASISSLLTTASTAALTQLAPTTTITTTTPISSSSATGTNAATTTIFSSQSTYSLLVKYLLPTFLIEIIQHSFAYCEYMKLLRPLTKNEDDREAFVQSEGLLKPMMKLIERKLRQSNLESIIKSNEWKKKRSNLVRNSKLSSTSSSSTTLVNYQQNHENEKLLKGKRKLLKLINSIEGLDVKTKNLLINSQQGLIFQGYLCKVRKLDPIIKAPSSFININNHHHHPRHHRHHSNHHHRHHSSHPERYAFLFESHLILVKEAEHQCINNNNVTTTATNNNATNHNILDEIANDSSSLLEQQSLLVNNDQQMDHYPSGTDNTDTISIAKTEQESNQAQEPCYKFKEKILIKKVEIVENESNSEDACCCFDLKGGNDRMMTTTITLKAKNEEEKRKWFSKILLICCKSRIDKTLDLIQREESLKNPLRLPSKDVYIFSEPDSPENIIFESSGTTTSLSTVTTTTATHHQQQQQLIKGATLVKLIERLTYHSFADPMFVKIFLLTFRSFVSCEELLQLLIQRFNIPSNPSSSCDDTIHLTIREDLKRYKKEFLEPIQFRVLNVIRHWIDQHFQDDFKVNQKLKEDLQNFLKSIVNRNMLKWVQSILKIIKRKDCECQLSDECEKKKEKFFSEVPPPIEHWLTQDLKKFNLMTLHPLEFGRQLTLYEFDLYCEVKVNELIDIKWMKEDRDREAPTLMRMIRHTNNLTYYLAKEILLTPNFDERVALTSRIVEILQVLQELNNFNGILEIISAFNLSCIYRLEHTFSSLSYKQRKVIDEMQDLNSDHYRKYQEKLRSINPPCIPFLGNYLTNILHLEEGNADFIDSSNRLINFSKRRKIAEITTEIQQYQQQPYSLQIYPDLRQFIASLDPLQGFNDKQSFENYLYEQSLTIEPRGQSKPFKGGTKRFADLSTLKSPGIKPSSMSTSNKPSSLPFVQSFHSSHHHSSQQAHHPHHHPCESSSPLISPKTPPNQNERNDSVFAKILIPSSSSTVSAPISTPPPLPPRIAGTAAASKVVHQRTLSESSQTPKSPPAIGSVQQPSSPANPQSFTFNFSIPLPPPPPPPRISRASVNSETSDQSSPPPLPPRGITPQSVAAAVSRHASVLSPPPRRNSSSLSPPPYPPPFRRSSSSATPTPTPTPTPTSTTTSFQPSLPPRTYQLKRNNCK